MHWVFTRAVKDPVSIVPDLLLKQISVERRAVTMRMELDIQPFDGKFRNLIRLHQMQQASPEQPFEIKPEDPR